MKFLLLVVILPFISFENSFAGPDRIGYQGRLFDSAGEPLDSGEVSLTIQVMDPLASCVLFEDSHTIEMGESNGYFSINLGSGNQNISTAPNFTLSEAFANTGTLNDENMGCIGNSYTPALADKRLLRVTVDESTLTPDLVVNSIPYSLYANESNSLGGKSIEQIEDEYQQYSNTHWAGQPLPESPVLIAGDSFRWDGTKWVIFQPGSAVGLTDVIGGLGLTESGLATKTIDIGVGNGLTANADTIEISGGDGLEFNSGVLQVKLGSGLHFNSGAVEINEASIDFNELANTPLIATNVAEGLLSASDKGKLDGIAIGAEVNVNADWNAVAGDAQILNKPGIPSSISELSIGNDSISGSAIDGGIISNFSSSGILDNAVATALTLDMDGNVGIGAPPVATLSVSRGSSANGTAVFSGTTFSSHFNYATDEHTFIRGGKATSGVLINDVASGNVSIATGGGNVGIGVAVPASRLEVFGNMKSSGGNAGIWFQDRTISLIDWAWYAQGDSASLWHSITGNRITVSGLGNLTVAGCVVYNGGTSGSCFSDKRVKRDITKFNPGLTELIQLEPVYYRYNGLAGTVEDTSKKIGVIAQDVEKVVPEIVDEREIQLRPEDTDLTKIKSVNYNALVYMVVNSIKSFYSKYTDFRDLTNLRIEEQNQSIELLRSEIEKLQKLRNSRSCLQKKNGA